MKECSSSIRPSLKVFLQMNQLIGQCRAIYDYTDNMYDEHSFKYVISIHHK